MRGSALVVATGVGVGGREVGAGVGRCLRVSATGRGAVVARIVAALFGSVAWGDL